MNKVRLGIVGYGTIGSVHSKYLMAGEVPDVELTAVSDSNVAFSKEKLPKDVKFYKSADELFASGDVDAVLITTPHYSHPELAIMAFKHNLHVLIEKPAGVHTKYVRQMNTAACESKKVFAIMFNQRTYPIHKKLKDIVDSGELGEIKRTNWIITTWYRPQSYYDAGGWRATWSGEGGGVLLNQCPHQLDLWQWICGMPKSVRAFCGFGKYHNIEVEDDVTAYVEYENGATGVFITSTGETPGTNRFEIIGDRGKIVMEDNKLIFWRTQMSERQFNREFKGMFGEPECSKCEIPFKAEDGFHKDITKNFINAILKKTPLIAPGEEGIHSLSISNAMLLSTWLDSSIDLPIDDNLFFEKLQEQIKNSTFHKDVYKRTLVEARSH